MLLKVLKGNNMNIALIGVGYWGSKIRKYIPNHFTLKYEADSSSDLNVIWNDKNIKAVIIATPIETHYELCKEALLYGKHVFCEKPITTHYHEALYLKKLADKKGLYLAVDYVQTFSPAIRKVQGLLKELSTITYIEMSTKHLGRFMEQDVYKLLASHHLSILGLFTNLSSLKIKKFNKIYNEGLCTSGTLAFTGGNIDVSLNFPGKEMYATIYGEGWTIKYTPLGNSSVTYTKYNKNFMELPDELTEEVHTFKYDEYNNLEFAIKYFKDLILGQEQSNIENAVCITKILSYI